jgi:hypothetical protein
MACCWIAPHVQLSPALLMGVEALDFSLSPLNLMNLNKDTLNDTHLTNLNKFTLNGPLLMSQWYACSAGAARLDAGDAPESGGLSHIGDQRTTAKPRHRACHPPARAAAIQ